MGDASEAERSVCRKRRTEQDGLRDLQATAGWFWRQCARGGRTAMDSGQPEDLRHVLVVICSGVVDGILAERHRDGLERFLFFYTLECIDSTWLIDVGLDSDAS